MLPLVGTAVVTTCYAVHISGAVAIPPTVGAFASYVVTIVSGIIIVVVFNFVTGVVVVFCYYYSRSLVCYHFRCCHDCCYFHC